MGFEIAEELGTYLSRAERPRPAGAATASHDAVPAVAQDANTVLTELFRDHHLELVRLALFILGDKGAAEDVVQDSFTAVHRRADRLTDLAGALPYIRTSVINGCRAALRRRAVAHRFALMRGREAEPAVVWSAESAALLGEDRREVLIALNTLPRRQREVLVLRYYFDLSEAEIAETMGVSRGTVKSTASRALAALARKLGEDS